MGSSLNESSWWLVDEIIDTRWPELQEAIFNSIVKGGHNQTVHFTRTPVEDKVMLYEVAIVAVDKDGNATKIVMPVTEVIAEDRDAAIVEATRNLGAEGAVVDTKAIRVLVRAFPG